jgi:hypothetical protein
MRHHESFGHIQCFGPLLRLLQSNPSSRHLRYSPTKWLRVSIHSETFSLQKNVAGMVCSPNATWASSSTITPLRWKPVASYSYRMNVEWCMQGSLNRRFRHERGSQRSRVTGGFAQDKAARGLGSLGSIFALCPLSRARWRFHCSKDKHSTQQSCVYASSTKDVSA